MQQIVIANKPGGTGLTKSRLEFIRVSRRKAEILIYKMRLAKAGMWKENEWDLFYSSAFYNTRHCVRGKSEKCYT